MTDEGHYDSCDCTACQCLRGQTRERREYLALTFHQRKAWRVAQRTKGEHDA